jgi:lipoyl-dependent peroxiredoxin
MIKREAHAVWRGTGKEGKGEITTQSGILKSAQYGFNTRFENGPGTNPEELIGAAHSGCYAMALSFALNEAGFTAKELKVSAQVGLEKEGAGFTITTVALKLDAQIPEISEAKFKELAEGAKKNCPVSKVLNAKITLEANLAKA